MKLQIIALSATLVILGACSANKKPQTAAPFAPVAPSSIPDSNPIPREMPQNATLANVVVSGDIVISKSSFDGLFLKEYLFGSDVQMSDEAGAVLAGGAHVISRFERHGDRLILVGDESLLKESDFPAKRTLVEFEITAEQGNVVGLKLSQPGAASAVQWGVKSFAQQWIRSAEFDANDEIFLLETSIVSEGKSHHFMESVFPRGKFGNINNALIQSGPNVSNDSTTDSFLNVLSRIGLFPTNSWTQPLTPGHWSDRVAKKEQVSLLRYDISENRTIDWYVTGNLPDTLLPDIAAGIEGWNRYFNEFRSNSPVMRFKGKLPAGVKLGDPRYNVVLFDAVADAPAAYESQDYDPATGIQTHSMIYMPFAWYNIGKGEYSAALREYTPNAKLKQKTRCQRDLFAHETIETMVLEKGLTPEAAGRALLRSTLLHEVGHALGMQHNFAGSLKGEIAKRADNDWLYSDSVMDYNTPALEDPMLFKALDDKGAATDSTVGANLNYDRQFIDIAYNSAKQVLAKPEAFPALPYCNDDMADDTIGGINPLCVRYDFFGEPRERLSLMRSRLTSQDSYLDQSGGRYITLAGLIRRASAQAKTNIANADQANIVAVLSTEIEQITKFIRSIATAGYVSATSAMRTTAPLLGEWKAFSPDMIIGDDESLISGYASTPIFDTNGVVSEEKFVAYENEVRAAILVFLSDAISLTTNSNSQFEGALTQVYSAATELINIAKERNVSDDSLAPISEKLNAQIKSIRNRITDVAIKSVETLNTEGVVTDAKGQKSAARPNIASHSANQLFLIMREAVQAQKLSGAARLRAAKFLASFSARNPGWDSVTLTTSWKSDIENACKVVNEEFDLLEAKRQTAGYLSESECNQHETLAQIITILKG